MRSSDTFSSSTRRCAGAGSRRGRRQPCLPGDCSLLVKDSSTNRAFVTMVIITLRSSRYPSWESGPGHGWLVASAPLLGQRDWLLEQVSCQLPADSRARLFPEEAGSVTYPSAFRLEKEIQSIRFSSSLVRLWIYRRRAQTDCRFFPLVAQNDLSSPHHPHPTGLHHIERRSHHVNAFSLPLHPSDPVGVPG